MSHIRLRGKTYWIYYYDNGQRVQRSLKTKDKNTAEYYRREIENRIALGNSPLANKDITAKECFERFKTMRKGVLTEKSQSTDNYRIQRFFDDEGIIRLSQVTEPKVKSHLDKRIAGGISHQTANHTIRILKTFLNFCIRQKYIQSNPIKYIIRYPQDEVVPRFLTADEVRKLIEASKDTPIYMAVIIAIYTGMRYGEIERLKRQDVLFDEDWIVIRKSKSKKYRYVPLHQDLKEILKNHNGSLTEGFYTHPQTKFKFQWEKVVKKAGIEYLRFHDLRHTFASLMIKAGVDILTLSKILGHSTIKMTSQYSHLYQDHLQDSIKKLQLSLH